MKKKNIKDITYVVMLKNTDYEYGYFKTIEEAKEYINDDIHYDDLCIIKRTTTTVSEKIN